MAKTAIIYWSGTGNTREMAKAIQRGTRKAGAEAQIFEVEQFGADELQNYDGVFFGCPAMGDEVLEEGSFEPFFASVESKLQGMPVALFGSYGWGGGAWMDTWQERTKGDGAKLFRAGLTVENGPTDKDLAACEELGTSFVKSLIGSGA